MALELEDERAGVWLKLRFTVWSQHEVLEHLSIEKPCIRLTGLHAVTGLLRLDRDSEFFPHLETHLEIFGNLFEIVPHLIRSWRLVEGRIVTAVVALRFLTNQWP